METIKKYLNDDTVYNKMNMFISLRSSSHEATINEQLQLILQQLIPAMKSQSPLFKQTYQRTAYTGSYFKKTRVGAPEEFDLNLIIKLPLKDKDFEKFTTDRPGFTVVRIRQGTDILKALKSDDKAYREMKSFIDQDLYLNQDKFRSWMEGVLGKVADQTNNRIVLEELPYPVLIKRKSGPAFTLSFKLNDFENYIDIDLVPALAFSMCNPPPEFKFRNYTSIRYWYAIPKPLYNSSWFSPHHHWRLSFYELEKDLLDEYSTANRMKSIIRHLKKFRDTQNLSNIASYYIEILCLHEQDFFRNSRESYTYLFFTMLQKLCHAFENGKINFYWVDAVNLLEGMNGHEIRNIYGKLNNILKKIERNIKTDKFAIAEYVLPADELSMLRSHLSSNNINYQEMVNEFANEQIDEQNGNQGTCVII
ncbi:cyclic GMP-AMP synthase [Pseudomyrmex gracilis]|uniref:cyclic GMP-AMP synthase n=1 Tax=Pseudomyrmex gracilis TaxID=219809 RepID=UPI0009958918|nr:cyclic GMP-AMP synthase [Pseudomyrmex gracilis]